MPLDFDGYLMISGWDLSFVNAVQIKNGKPFRRIKLVSRDRLPQTRTETCPGAMYVPENVWVCVFVPSGDEISDQENCQENGHWYDEGGTYEFPECYDPGEGPDPLEDCMSTGSTEDCYCALWGIGCGSSGGGEITPPEILNHVTDPCLRNSVDNAISKDCRNKITGFVNTVFGSGNQFNLQFLNSYFPAGDLRDAETVVAYVSGSTISLSIITFNLNQLNNASVEYITATILHEVIHAWIDFQYPAGTALTQHEMMASQYRRGLIEAALQQMFTGMSPQEASDLSWGGLQNTTAYNSLPSSERQRIEQANVDFKNHVLGTPCSP